MRGSKHSSGLPLPKHFEEKETEKGRKYYINHKDQTTTWVDPRDAMTKKTSWGECEDDEMPYGWELATETKYNLQYWIDHNNKVNTVDDPRLAENRKEQEEFLKARVTELKKSMGRNRLTLRKTQKKLDVAKKKYDDIQETGDEDLAKEARMEYRRQLSLTNRVQRVVEEGEAKIQALEQIKFDEMNIQAASDVKEELATLNENFEKEQAEKEEIKAELQELKSLVSGYMASMSKTGKDDEIHLRVVEEENKLKRAEMVHTASIEMLKDLEIAKEEKAESATEEAEGATEEAKSAGEESPAAPEPKGAIPVPPPPPAAAHHNSSVAMKIELEQRKLERERQLQETAELKKAQRELRLLKEKQAEASKKDALPFHEIEEEDLPDWLFSSHVVKLLDIEGDNFDNDKDLQDEIKTKVKDYMEQQKEDADGLNFKSKLAFFTTLEIHDDVQRRKSGSRPKSVSSRPQSISSRPQSMSSKTAAAAK